LRPYYGIIADDIHVHPSFIRVAYNAHMDGTILVSDAMSMLGLPDGIYNWTNGEVIAKKGGKLTLRDTDTIAGRYLIFQNYTNLLCADMSVAA
jgi:N-acetylglucosamine-6-phosphate deacetylase